MKKTLIFSMVAGATLLLSSCDHLLNENRYPLDQQTNNPNYWNNEDNVAKQVNALYPVFVGYTGLSADFYFKTVLGDDQASGVGTAFANWTYTTVPSSSSTWSNAYINIRNANYIIDGVNSSTLADNVKAKYEGIARLIRAQQFYWLVRAYGDVPYVDYVLDVNSPELYGPRTDRDEVMDHVYNDLKYAAENIGTGTKTTWSSDLAYAMMSQICLYEGAYCKYRTVAENYKAPNVERAKKYFGYVVEAGNALMAKNYSLNSSYRANYNSTDLWSNPEMIMYKEYKMSTLTHSIINYITSTTEVAGISKDAFDAFLFKDGKPLALTSLDKNDAAELKTGVTGSDYDKVLSLQKVLDVRDNRLAETIDTVVCYASASNGYTYSRAGTAQIKSNSGYLIRKYDNTSIPIAYRNSGNYTCAPLYWLAVIYCDYAEAKAELGTLTDADLNNTLNKLYKRAELPEQTVASLTNMNDPANNMGVSSLLWEVRRCRRCETMMDADLRYWDLQRWHQLDKLDTQKYPNIRLGANCVNAQEGHKPAVTVGNYIKATPDYERVYSPRVYLYPLPTNQLSLNKELTQNALWAGQ